MRAPGDARRRHQRGPLGPGPGLGRRAVLTAHVSPPASAAQCRLGGACYPPWPGPSPLFPDRSRALGGALALVSDGPPLVGTGPPAALSLKRNARVGGVVISGAGAVTTPSHRTLSFRCLLRG